MHLILIDNHSGFIFADTRDMNEWSSSDYTDAEEAVIKASQMTDRINGNGNRHDNYTIELNALFVNERGYRVDTDKGEQVPVVYDGQNQELIDAVMEHCDYMGFVWFDIEGV